MNNQEIQFVNKEDFSCFDLSSNFLEDQLNMFRITSASGGDVGDSEDPMLKIHKLKLEQLKPGCKPPARLVTALNNGVTKRSDVFLAQKYLKDLEKRFCNDLLKFLALLNCRITDEFLGIILSGLFVLFSVS